MLNAAALKNGTGIVNYPAYPETDPNYFTLNKIPAGNPHCINDQRDHVWLAKNEPESERVLILELSENYLIEKLLFNNSCTNSDTSSCSKEVKVEVSATRSNAGFKELNTYRLEACTSSEFAIPATNARWIRITILSNHGNKKVSQLAEFEAWGRFTDKPITPFTATGRYTDGDRWISLERKNDGEIVGCFVANAQMMLGQAWKTERLKDSYFYFIATEDRRTYNGIWRSENGSLAGWFSFVINKEGDQMLGTWGYEEEEEVGIWYNRKNNHVSESCGENIVKIKLLDAETNVSLDGQIEVSDKNHAFRIKKNIGNFIVRDVFSDSTLTIKGFSKGYLEGEKTITILQKVEVVEIKLKKPKAGETIEFKNILFKKASSRMLPPSYKEVEKIAILMKDWPEMEIELHGHTDNIGKPERLLKLSEQRVLEVKKYLVKKGIDTSRIKTVGFGGTKPVADNEEEETRRLNRRVECKILKL